MEAAACPSDPALLSAARPAAAIATSGDLTLAEGAVVHESLHADGLLHIGARVVVEGSVASHTAADVGEGARIAGSLDVSGPVVWGTGASAGRAFVLGPFVTRGGVVRTRSLDARAGVHPAVARQEGADPA